MSTYIYKFLELKGEDGKWHLLQWKDHTGKICSELCSHTLKQYLDDHSIEASDYAGRGYPDDLSEEMKVIVAEHQTEVQKKREEGTLFMNSDWHWGRSWVTLEELNTLYEKLTAEYTSEIEKAYAKAKFEKYDKKMDLILSILKKEPEIYKGNENDGEEEDSEYDYMQTVYDYKEMYEEAQMIDAEIYHLRCLADMMGYDHYFGDDEIRIIYYLS